MNIKYEIVLKDYLDARQTEREYSLSKDKFLSIPVRYIPIIVLIISIGLIIGGLIDRANSASIVLIRIGIFGLILALILFCAFQTKFSYSPFFNRRLKQQWSKYYLQEHLRNIIITQSEFIFKTSNSEMTWNWQSFKEIYEGTEGFIISFFTGHTRYIPKRIFSSRIEMEEFKKLIKHYSQ